MNKLIVSNHMLISNIVIYLQIKSCFKMLQMMFIHQWQSIESFAKLLSLRLSLSPMESLPLLLMLKCHHHRKLLNRHHWKLLNRHQKYISELISNSNIEGFIFIIIRNLDQPNQSSTSVYGRLIRGVIGFKALLKTFFVKP